MGLATGPRLNDKVDSNDLLTMETNNKVLTGDLSTGEGEWSSRKVQQHAV
jgi:hypothetical protein